MEARFAGRTDTEFSPKAQIWHRFKVQVGDSGERVEIRAKIWQAAGPEPARWQIDCFDVGSSRSSKGSVGVWACSEGEKYFDDLLVRPIYARTEETPPENSIGSESIARDSLSAKVNDGSEREGRSGEYLLRENFDRFAVGAHPRNWGDGLAPVDFSEAADRVSRFFRMNLLDFGGPWDEIVDWATIVLTFCLAGLLAGIALRHRGRIRHSKASNGWIWRIPFEFVPFVALSVYYGAMKGVVVVLYAGAGLGAGCLWRFLHTLLLKLFPSPTDRTRPTIDHSA